MGPIIIFKKNSFWRKCAFFKNLFPYGQVLGFAFCGSLAKGIFYHKIPWFWEKVWCNCIPYERVFKIFSFHILSVAKFG
jgi:hypothetical protein